LLTKPSVLLLDGLKLVLRRGVKYLTPTLSNMLKNVLAPDGLLGRALTTHDTTVRKVALLVTLLVLIELTSP